MEETDVVEIDQEAFLELIHDQVDRCQHVGVRLPGDEIVLVLGGDHELDDFVDIVLEVDGDLDDGEALKDVEEVTPQQKARRAAWLRGEAEGDGSR